VRASQARGTAAAPVATFAFVLPSPLWQAPAALVLYAFAATALVAGVVRLVSYRRLRTRLARLAQQQAMQRERMRIAQDMHDEIGSKLTKISFLSERAKGELGAHAAAGKLDSIASTSRDLLQSLDEIVWAVNPHNDTLEHLAGYLGHYATEYLQNTPVECELHIPRGLPVRALSSETRHNLFLAFEETLNNVLKHSGARNVRIEMAVAPQRFAIPVTDDGRGFDAQAPSHRASGGNGLVNLRQRLADVGGACHIASTPGQGTCVSLEIPLAGKSAPALV
jgi:signal transduction histidine kinase